jgi:ribosomal protein S8E
MPWLDDVAPDAPTIQKKNVPNFVVNYNGKEKIKSFGIFSCGLGVKANTKNAQLVKLIVATKTAIIDISNMAQKKNEKFYVASIDLNNNVSTLVELN